MGSPRVDAITACTAEQTMKGCMEAHIMLSIGVSKVILP